MTDDDHDYAPIKCYECRERYWSGAPDGRCDDCYFGEMMMQEHYHQQLEEMALDAAIRDEYWDEAWREELGLPK